MENNSFTEQLTDVDIINSKYQKKEIIITPNILRTTSRLALVGEPKVGKSYFLLNWMAHMAAGVSYMGMKPSRPMKVLYIQTKIQEPYFKERIQKVNKDILSLASDNLAFYLPKEEISLDEHGVKKIAHDIERDIENETIDIIAIDATFFEGCLKLYRGKQSEKAFSFRRGLNKLSRHINPMAAMIFNYGFDNSKKTFPNEIPIFEYNNILMSNLNHNDSTIKLTFDIVGTTFDEGEISTKIIKKVEGQFVEVDKEEDCVKFIRISR